VVGGRDRVITAVLTGGRFDPFACSRPSSGDVLPRPRRFRLTAAAANAIKYTVRVTAQLPVDMYYPYIRCANPAGVLVRAPVEREIRPDAKEKRTVFLRYPLSFHRFFRDRHLYTTAVANTTVMHPSPGKSVTINITYVYILFGLGL